MEIVINIPDGCYEELTTANFPIQDSYRLVAWIKDGIPLPKGHGRLIDADALEVSVYREVIKYQYINEFSPDEPVYEYTNYYKCKTIKNAPTIIEANKEVE